MPLKDLNDPVGDLQLQATGFVAHVTTQVNKYIAEQTAEATKQVTFLQKSIQERVLAQTKAVELAAKRALGTINKFL